MSMTVDSQHNTVSDIAQVNQGQPHCAKKRRADAPQTAPSGPKARLSACRTDKPSSLMSVERACSHSTTAPKSRRCRAHTTPPRAARWSCAGAADALPAEPRPAWWRPPAVPRWRGSSARPRAPTSRRPRRRRAESRAPAGPAEEVRSNTTAEARAASGAAGALPAEPRSARRRPPVVSRWRGSSARPRAPTARRPRRAAPGRGWAWATDVSRTRS